MINLLIYGGKKAYLPQRYAYKSYFSKHGFSVDLVQDLDQVELSRYHVLWTFMGMDRISLDSNQVRVHEYQSIPVDNSRFQRFIKKGIKNLLSYTPDMRVYKNDAVQSYFDLDDTIPYCYRDVGVDDAFFNQSYSIQKEYDFVYHGAMSGERKIDVLINCVGLNFPRRKMLLVGAMPPNIEALVERYDNIDAIGKIDYKDVASQLTRAEYGLHYIPNRYPFNVQMSLKLLEYCALGLKVISTKQSYIDQFQNDHKGRFLIVKDDLSDFTETRLGSFPFQLSDVSSYSWNKVLDTSGIVEKLKMVLSKKR